MQRCFSNDLNSPHFQGCVHAWSELLHSAEGFCVRLSVVFAWCHRKALKLQPGHPSIRLTPALPLWRSCLVSPHIGSPSFLWLSCRRTIGCTPQRSLTRLHTSRPGSCSCSPLIPYQGLQGGHMLTRQQGHDAAKIVMQKLAIA